MSHSGPAPNAAVRRTFLSRTEPHQWLTLSLCGLILGVTLISHLLRGGLSVHIGRMAWLTAGYGAASLFLHRWTSNSAKALGQSLLTLMVMFTLYFVLASLAFAVMPYSSDSFLAGADSLWGLWTAPALAIQPYSTPALIEALSFCYGVFIPYVYMSIFVSLLGRPEEERRVFILAVTLAYCVGFLGYLFVPAKGPVAFYADDVWTPLQGGLFHRLVVDSVARCGGPHGAFPSLHVGVSWVLCAFDLKYNRIRGLLYLPLVLSIMVATVFLRYHYVVDLIAGLVLGTAAVKGAVAWEARRRARV